MLRIYLGREELNQIVHKKRKYVSLRALLIATSNRQEMTIEKQWTHADWKTIWKNLTITPTSGADKMNWYKVIHDVIPTNVRLHRIRISPTYNCSECSNTDTLEHRLTDCGKNKMHWEWIQKIIARMLRTSPMNIPRDCLLRQHFCLWPPQRQRSVLWLSRYVTFTLSRRGKQDPQDLMEFLRRSRWKRHQMPGRRKLFANFLTVLDTF